MKINKKLSNPHGHRVFRPAAWLSGGRPYRTYGLLALAFTALVVAGSSWFPKADAQNTRARFEQDLAQVFINHEDLTVNPQLVADQVRTSGRVSLVTTAHDFELELEPNDLRAPNYRAEQTDSDGVTRATAMPGLVTYKGNVAGAWGSDARFTIDGDKVEGMIITPGQSYFVEPARKYSSSAAPTDYLLYSAADV
ncbi:MAG TPA: hypothetical protein VE961_24715, partial [Pyrinomonadaceae bacterium]|nr:hypothetical protein [Pyrinomonadaceae bacterium]